MYIPTTALVLGALAAIITVAASIDTNTEQLQFIWHTPGQDTLDHHGPPHHKPLPWPGTGQETIYTVLSNDKEYTKLIKAVNFAGEIVSVLNDSSAHLTFFAVPDSALRNPHKRTLDADISTITSLEQVYDLSDVIHLVDEFDAYSSSDQDDDDKKKCKKFLQKLVRAILSYHILPSRFGVTNLGDNTTYATNLVLPDALGARPLRIRVHQSLVSPSPTLNFYSRVIRPNGPAINGIIHGISHPLLPPPAIFQELFMVPSLFSTFTSAIQRTGLTDSLDLHWVRGNEGEKATLKGQTAVTVFAPSNRAFQRLPHKLQIFLFSPFGRHVLKKILQYHIVPDLIFHTDYQYNISESKPQCHHTTFDISKIQELGTDSYPLQLHVPSEQDYDSGGDFMPWGIHLPPLHLPSTKIQHPKHDPISSLDAKLQTALTNHFIHAHVEKFKVSVPIPGPHKPHKITTKLTVNGRHVFPQDIVGLNGAIHVIDHLLDPRGQHHHRHSHDKFTDADPAWVDWQDWLPQWAD